MISLAPPTPGPQSFAYRALFRKNLTIQARQKGTNCCQIFTPILVMLLMVILQLIIKSELGGSTLPVETFPTPYILNAPPLVAFPIDQASSSQPFYAASSATTKPWMRFVNSWLSDGSSTSGSDSGSDAANGTGSCLYFMLYSWEAGVDPAQLGTLTSGLNDNGTEIGTNNTGLLGKMKQTECFLANGTSVSVPYFSERSDEDQINTELFQDLLVYSNSSLENLNKAPLWYLLPDGGVSFGSLDIEAGQINYTLAVNNDPNVFYHRPNNITRLNLPDLNQTLVQQIEMVTLTPLWGQLRTMDSIHYALLSSALNETIDSNWGDSYDFLFEPSRIVVGMPYNATQDVLVIVEAFGTFLYPIALSLQLPIYIYMLVMEKADRLREMMKSMGMRTSSYILTSYVFCFVLYSAVAAFFWIAGLIARIRFFSETGSSTLFFFFFGWGHALVSLAFFFSAIINSKRAATVVGYVIALMGTLIGLVICVGIYGDIPFSVAAKLPAGFLAWPQFALCRGVYLMNLACAADYNCYGQISSVSWDDELSKVLLALYLGALFYFLLGLYLDAVLPREFGVPKSPLFFLDWIREKSRKVTRGSMAVYKENESSTASRVYDPSAPLLGWSFKETVGDDEDKDVKAERRKVAKNHHSGDCPLIIRGLHKRFPAASGSPSKIAVVDLWLAVERGECFGLLGENGAGKTTTISMLTGMYPPTSGHAFIGGYDIRTNIDQVHLMMGVCPQFNVLWEELTVKEHLLFYTRLKGVPPQQEISHVERSMQEVGLGKYADRKSKDLSGGMKRRLSVAIALVGNSSIVFLDEPTTGLDPASRRQMWHILQRAKRGRAIVLTTHAMDEAELLCNRIGILAKGRLRCLGSPTHLQQKFGGGYKLTINFSPSSEEQAVQCVNLVFPNATQISSFKGTITFSVPREHLRFSEAFALLEARGRIFGISAFSLCQFGLEDVFQRIVHTVNTGKWSNQSNDELEDVSEIDDDDLRV